MLSALTWDFSGEHLDLLESHRTARTAGFVWALRGLDDATKDPRLIVSLDRRLRADGWRDICRVENATSSPVHLTITCILTVSVAPLSEVRSGTARPRTVVPSHDGADTMVFEDDERGIRIHAQSSLLRCVERDNEHQLTVTWAVDIPAKGKWSKSVDAHVWDRCAAVESAGCPIVETPTSVPSEDLARWLKVAKDDLNALALRLSEPEDGGLFVAAGAPWYLTLFGRDSIWTALMLLPHSLELASGTLRALAGRQATNTDPAAAAEPGKILHELRSRAQEVPREGLWFPAVYYGSSDATPLWILLLAEASDAGMPQEQVVNLVPTLRRAARWLLDQVLRSPTGFLSYFDESGRGLANQGWKDSSDAMRFHDGKIAQGTLALCEMQGYAYEAARRGARLLEVLGQESDQGLVSELDTMAEGLRDRFAAEFWVDHGDGRFPAAALTRSGEPVDSLTSNIGHLIGTGLLSHEEEVDVARALTRPEMLSGFGLRTLSSENPGYWPLSYHCGSVWAHDTAIVVRNLGRAGLTSYVPGLCEALIAAASAFDYRMPELFGGQSRAEFPVPVRYPTSCLPNAWSAAAAFAVREALEACRE